MDFEMNDLYYRDARTALMGVDSESFDLVVTAPPPYEYRNDREPWKNRYSYLWTSLDTYLEEMRKVFIEVFRVLKNHHCCIITVGDVKGKLGVGKWEVRSLPLAAYFIRVMEDIGFTYVNEYIWDKGEPSGVSRKKGPYYPFRFNAFNCCEHVMVFAKHVLDTTPEPCPICGGDKLTQAGYGGIGIRRWQCMDPKCKALEKRDTGKVYSRVSIMVNDYMTENNIIPDELEMAYRRGFIHAAPVTTDYKEYTTTTHTMLLPMEIAEMAVLYYSGVGDKILDPFMGSGMTAAVANKYGREFLGFIFDKNCYDRAIKVVDEINRPKRFEEIKRRLAEMKAGN